MPLVQIVSGIIENNRGNFLLVMEREGNPKGSFKFPTGNITRGEQPVDALRREIREETSYTLANPRLLDHYIGRGAKGDDLEFFDFYARKRNGIFVPNREVREIKWVDMGYLREMQTRFRSDTTHYHRIDLLLDFKNPK